MANGKQELTLPLLHQLYDDPATSETAGKIHQAISAALGNIDKYMASNDREAVNRTLRFLEDEVLKGRYDIAPMQEFYISEGRLPYLSDDSLPLAKQAENRLTDIKSYYDDRVSSVAGDLTLASNALQIFKTTMNEGDDNWFFDDKEFEQFRDDIGNKKELKEYYYGAGSSVTSFERPPWSQDYEISEGRFDKWTTGFGEQFDTETILPSETELTALTDATTKYIITDEYGSVNSEKIMKELNNYVSKVNSKRDELDELNYLIQKMDSEKQTIMSSLK